MPGYFDFNYFFAGEGGAGPGLVSESLLESSVASQGYNAAQMALVPGLSGFASELIRKHCNRYFNRRVYDGIYSIEPPSRAFLLRQFPVNRLVRCLTEAQEVIFISQADRTTNQQASVSLRQGAGSDIADVPSPVTGLDLTRMASGVETVETIDFMAAKTLDAVRVAVGAIGDGWTCKITPGYEQWPTADLRSGQGPTDALWQDGSSFCLYTATAPVTYDSNTGKCVLRSSPYGSAWNNPRWGPGSYDEDPPIALSGIRMIYDAGWDTIPGPVQQATIETVIDMLSVLKLDQRVSSETDGAYSYVLNTAFSSYALPRSVVGKIDYYRNH